MSARIIIPAAIFALLPQVASAHRLDEYLQAARLAVSRQAVIVELDLTPGAAMAATILARVDRDRDGRIDPLEADAYGRGVVGDLVLTIDGRPLPLALTSTVAPETREMEDGVGAIRLVARAPLEVRPADRMVVRFRNNHADAGSVYLVNALKPADGIVLDRMSRDAHQREIELDYRIGFAAHSQLLWVFIAALGFAGLVVMRSAGRTSYPWPWHTARWLTREDFVRNRIVFALAGSALVLGSLVTAQSKKPRLNPVIELLSQQRPVFGLYAPSNRRGGGRGGPGAPGAAPATPAPAPAPDKSPAELAREAVAYKNSDFVFDGSMEGGLDRALPAFSAFVAGMKDAGALTKSPLHFTHPLIVKTPEADAPTLHPDIGRQLNLGVSGLMLPKAESAEQVRQAIAAMRFKSKGGTRPDDVGTAPAYWGLSEAEYRERADVWPLNPDGELINWTIVESKEGLARVREIAAVKGIGVLWPGAGTLRGIFTTTSPSGERVFDEKGWEGAIQQVLAACKEFKVACGFPANANDIEMRMKQGFSVFVMNWGDPGFKALEAGRRIANRPLTNE